MRRALSKPLLFQSPALARAAALMTASILRCLFRPRLKMASLFRAGQFEREPPAALYSQIRIYECYTNDPILMLPMQSASTPPPASCNVITLTSLLVIQVRSI